MPACWFIAVAQNTAGVRQIHLNKQIEPVTKFAVFMSAACPTPIRVCPKNENSRGEVSSHDHGELCPGKEFRQEETPAGYFANFTAQIPDPQPTAIRTT